MLLKYIGNKNGGNDMRMMPIASGSSGNCIYVGSDDTHILIDAGISRKKIEEGLPVLATCAGLILLAQNISNDENRCFATLPVTVKRNAYGRQLGSFYYEGEIKEIGTFPMEFIRAPYIESVEKNVEILAQVEEKIVGVAYKNQLAFSFHPELTGNDRIHDKFIELIKVSNN